MYKLVSKSKCKWSGKKPTMQTLPWQCKWWCHLCTICTCICICICICKAKAKAKVKAKAKAKANIKCKHPTAKQRRNSCTYPEMEIVVWVKFVLTDNSTGVVVDWNVPATPPGAPDEHLAPGSCCMRYTDMTNK